MLKHISELIHNQHDLQPAHIQLKGDFLEQSFQELRSDDRVVIGRVGERSEERNKPMGSNVENFI
ncbi:hypothetical protein, partial [Mycobacteroides abscessus]|uniref:hypothetical protein n=1 Tax=Mycobacteroides abscessus TaxID=36809 RepID=UPI001C89D897